MTVGGSSGGGSPSEGESTPKPAPIPGVDVPFPRRPVPLHAQLFASGRRFLDAALTAYGNDEHDVFALHAGVAIEHLMKARLASVNPMLVLDTDGKPSVEAKLWLADPTKHTQPPPSSLYTVGGKKAADLLSRMIGLGSYVEVLSKLRDQRNGIGHFGSADLASIVDDLPMILRAAEHLATGLTDDPREVFGRHQRFASSQLDEWAEEVGRRLAGRYEVARQRLADLDPPLTPALREARRGAIEDTHRNDPHRTLDDQLAPCPICGLPARLDGRLWAQHEPDYEHGEYSGSYLVGEFDAERLACSTCGLVLDGDLLNESGALENWEVPQDDVERAADAYAEAMWEASLDDR